MGVCVRACVLSMFCGLGIDVVTHRCWLEDSSSGCGFHEGSFFVISHMLIPSHLTRNLQSNTILLVRLFLSCGARTNLAVGWRSWYSLHFELLAHFLRYLFFYAEGPSPIATPVSHLVFRYDAFLRSLSSFLAG